MKGARPEELISECSTANIDFLLRNWNNKQYNELKNKCFLSSRRNSSNYVGESSVSGIQKNSKEKHCSLFCSKVIGKEKLLNNSDSKSDWKCCL